MENIHTIWFHRKVVPKFPPFCNHGTAKSCNCFGEDTFNHVQTRLSFRDKTWIKYRMFNSRKRAKLQGTENCCYSWQWTQWTMETWVQKYSKRHLVFFYFLPFISGVSQCLESFSAPEMSDLDFCYKLMYIGNALSFYRCYIWTKRSGKSQKVSL